MRAKIDKARIQNQNRVTPMGEREDQRYHPSFGQYNHAHDANKRFNNMQVNINTSSEPQLQHNTSNHATTSQNANMSIHDSENFTHQGPLITKTASDKYFSF